jgi:hypothetical protein
MNKKMKFSFKQFLMGPFIVFQSSSLVSEIYLNKISLITYHKEKFADTKLRSCKLKDRHFNGQKKKNNNDQQNTIQKNKD